MNKSVICIINCVWWFASIMDIIINLAEYILTGNIKEVFEAATSSVLAVNDGKEVLWDTDALEDLDILDFDDTPNICCDTDDEDPFSDEDIEYAQYVEEFEDVDFYSEMTYIRDLEYRFMKTLRWKIIMNKYIKQAQCVCYYARKLSI